MREVAVKRRGQGGESEPAWAAAAAIARLSAGSASRHVPAPDCDASACTHLGRRGLQPAHAWGHCGWIGSAVGGRELRAWRCCCSDVTAPSLPSPPSPGAGRASAPPQGHPFLILHLQEVLRRACSTRSCLQGAGRLAQRPRDKRARAPMAAPPRHQKADPRHGEGEIGSFRHRHGLQARR